MSDNESNEEKKEELGLYEKLAMRTKAILEETKVRTSETLGAAMEKAKEEMLAAGDFGSKQGEKLKSFMQRDLIISQKYASKAGEAAKKTLEPHRVAAGIQNTIAGILETVGGRLESWGEKLEDGLNFKTGEITTPGTLTCKRCEKKIKMHGAGHIPPCPECQGTEFHKGY